MVAKAKEELEQEILIKEEEKEKYLTERAPPLNTSGLNLQQLQVYPASVLFEFSLNLQSSTPLQELSPLLSSATEFF